MVKLLLTANARIQIKDIFSQTLLDLAREAGTNDVIYTLAKAIIIGRGGDSDSLRCAPTEELVRSYGKTYVPERAWDSPRILPRDRLDSPRLEENKGLKLSLPIPGENQATSLKDLLEAAAKRSVFNNRSFFPRKVLISVLTRQRVLADMSKYLARFNAINALEKVCPIHADGGTDKGNKSDDGSPEYQGARNSKF